MIGQEIKWWFRDNWKALVAIGLTGFGIGTIYGTGYNHAVQDVEGKLNTFRADGFIKYVNPKTGEAITGPELIDLTKAYYNK